MRTHLAGLVLVSVVMAGLVGCSGASPPVQTGFLGNYMKLQPEGPNTLRYIAPGRLGDYSSFIIDPVQVYLHDPANAAEIPPSLRAELRTYMRGALVEALSGPYRVVSTPGPGVARIRVALTDIKKSNAALNVLPQTRMTGLGLGGASVEAEVLDSQTGQQIAALVESKMAQRLNLPAGWSELGDAKAVMTDWANRFRRRLDEAHQQ